MKETYRGYQIIVDKKPCKLGHDRIYYSVINKINNQTLAEGSYSADATTIKNEIKEWKLVIDNILKREKTR